MSRGRQPVEPRVRFWSKVDKSGECWDWRGYVRAGNGYGQFGISQSKTVYAHRFAYEDRVGQIPEGFQVDHTCHNRTCVNPAHLRAVTHKQNTENLSGARADNKQGLRGVGLNRRNGKYRVKVTHNGSHYHGGQFTTLEEAAEAARQLRLSLFTHNDADRRTA